MFHIKMMKEIETSIGFPQQKKSIGENFKAVNPRRKEAAGR